MRVLFVSPVVPWPPDSGGRIRTARLVEHAARDAEVHLWCVAQPNLDPEAPAELGALAREVRLFPRSRAPLVRRLSGTRPERWFHSAALECALRDALTPGTGRPAFDLVHLDELNLVRSLPPEADLPVVVHHHKLDRELHAALRGRRPVCAALEHFRLARLEALGAARHREHLVCCAEDAARLVGRHPELHVEVVPNGFDPRHFQPPPPGQRSGAIPPGIPETPPPPGRSMGGGGGGGIPRDSERLLFLGTLSYGPNVEGLRWFVRAVLPALRATRPGLTLDVVGRDPTPAVRALAECPGVHLVGGVDDVRPWLIRSAALVPLSIGGGTRLKIVEALAMRTPVIAASTAAEGLPLEDRVHLDLAEGPAEFTTRILGVLDDPAAARARAERGRRLVARTLPWERLAAGLVACWSAAIERADRMRREQRIPARASLPVPVEPARAGRLRCDTSRT